MNERDDNDGLNDELRALGAEVGGLPSVEPLAGLAARTLDRVRQECKPVKKVFFMLRPITNPIARLSAAAAIVFLVLSLADMDTADRLGSRIEQRILGRAMTDRVEGIVDNLLVRYSNNNYSQAYLDVYMDTQAPNVVNRKRPVKPENKG